MAAKFDGKKFDAGEVFGTYEYRADREGGLSVRLPTKFGDEPFPLQYVLGSGHTAQTLLTLAPGLDGQTEGIEHRVSCYPGGRIDLTPGHPKMTPQSALEFFGDSSSGVPLQRCIYCHTTSARIVGEGIEDLVNSINCEKCHGPGSEHVRIARTNPTPPAYSVGRNTWDTESEMQLCGDCHRLPRHVTEKEIRDYPDLLVRFQPVGMLRSRCYLDSARELKCTTCHNPHQTIREMKTADHVKNCRSCHEPDTKTHVACPINPETGCIDCHMPAIELEQGIRFHDHWIRVREQ
ncbi:MAG: cytochrome c3 family protein [Rubripirellula sp.]